MSWLSKTILKIRRGEGPVYAYLKKAFFKIMSANLPQPALLKTFYRGLYGLHRTLEWCLRWLISVLYCEPALRARCIRAGRHWHVWMTPFITGHPEIYIGDRLRIFGKVDVASGRLFDHPKLIIGNDVVIGHLVQIIVNKEIIIEDQVNIASRVYICDNDGHPRDPELRAKGLPPLPEEVKPVRICRGAWLGQNCFVMKGVTIGEGAIIGANSVVTHDVPPYAVAAGCPARIVVKDTRTRNPIEANTPAGRT